MASQVPKSADDLCEINSREFKANPLTELPLTQSHWVFLACREEDKVTAILRAHEPHVLHAGLQGLHRTRAENFWSSPRVTGEGAGGCLPDWGFPVFPSALLIPRGRSLQAQNLQPRNVLKHQCFPVFSNLRAH